jgi:hypothetical protein
MNRAQKKYYQLIPENINNELKTISELIRPSIKGFSEDNLKEVISMVACHIRKDDKAIPLSMVYINRLVPQGQKYLRGLLNLGIMRRSGQYIPKKVCYKYDFALRCKSRYVFSPLKNTRLILRIEKVWSELQIEASKSIWGYSGQVKYLKQLTLADGWREFAETYKANTHQYNCILSSAMRIVNGDIFYSIDPTEGRFHSNITNMKRELRSFLRINGEPLTNVDIKNSQPYLSTIILTYPSKISWLTKNPAFSMLLQTLKVSLTEDVKKYIYLVVSGQFYEYLMKEFFKEGLVLTRKETKLQVLRILFARNRLPKDLINRKARQIFIRNFPTVHRIFSKVRGRDQGTKFENSNRFAILLARIESYLMLEVIMKRINKELPKVIALTIHDSVMTGILTSDVDGVRKIMTEALNEFVGSAPKIEIENGYRGKEEVGKQIQEGKDIEEGVLQIKER